MTPLGGISFSYKIHSDLFVWMLVISGLIYLDHHVGLGSYKLILIPGAPALASRLNMTEILKG